MEISLPTIKHRDYQLPAWDAFQQWAVKRDHMARIAMVWPRRSGKDTESLQMLNFAAHLEPMNCWHLMPEATQVRKAMWNGINKAGQRIIDVAFPPELRERTNDSEMFIKLKCGSTIQFSGSDRYDSLVGANPRVVCFSEWPICNPRSYDFVRPILAENNGLAIFPFTPRGRNHGLTLFENLQADPHSFAELLTCDDTGHMTEAALELERKEMSEELYLQEYFGSFDFGLEGSFYARQMNQATTDGRVTFVPYDSGLPVFSGFDIGLRDSTAVWTVQPMPGGGLHWLNYHQASGEQPQYFSDYLLGLPYGRHQLFFPHDGGQHRFGMETSSAEQMEALGWSVDVLQRPTNVQAYIEDCRVAIGKSMFNAEGTEYGRSVLSAYRKEYDDKRQTFKDKPLHDWASDGADAFRYTVQAYNEQLMTPDWTVQPDYSQLNRAAI